MTTRFFRFPTRNALATVSIVAAAISPLWASSVMAQNKVSTVATTVAPPPVSAASRYPATTRGSVAEVQFGERIADPYRWLEDGIDKNPAVQAWVDAQRATTDAYLATLPGRTAFANRMRQLYDYERFGLPERAGKLYFFTRNNGLQPQSVLQVRNGLTGEPRTLIDPNSWTKDGTNALAEWVPSEDGKYLLFTLQDGGSDWRTVKVMDVATGKELPDTLRYVKFSGFAWGKDGKGFYYSRYPESASGEDLLSLNHNQAVYYHRVGTAQSDDTLVYHTPEAPERNNFAQVSDDGKWLIVTSSDGTDNRYAVHLIPIGKGRGKGATPTFGKPVALASELAHNWEYVTNVGDRFTFVTNKDAPRQRIVAVDIKDPGTLLPVLAEDSATLVGASRIGQRIIVSYLADAKSKVQMIDLNGRRVGDISLGEIGSASGFGGSAKSNETFYSFSSFNRPATIYRLDVKTGQSSVFAAPKLTFDPANFHVEQRFYTSRDGTRVPMFVIMKKGLERRGGSPTLLFGYGGFDISMTPSFSPARLAWLDAGGVLAIANLRGGGEYGKAWHDAGRLLNKQNVFDDFIAAGEYLKREGITGKDQLAIEGRSNGGLLIGAVVNQRPDLFAAALPTVGVMDMLRFDRFTAGAKWVDDYGYPGKETDFRNLRAFSPYHNIRDGVSYPAILVVTGDRDDRVVPGHSFKYAAALQAANIGDKPHIIRIDGRTGHGSGKPVDKAIAEYADMYAFIAHWTGLKVGE